MHQERLPNHEEQFKIKELYLRTIMKMFTAWSFIWSSIKVIICESILLPRKRPFISEKAVLNMASPDLRFVQTGGTGGPVEFFLTV